MAISRWTTLVWSGTSRLNELARDQVEPSDPPAVAGILSGSGGTLLVHSREKLQEISTEIHAGLQAFHPSPG